MCLLNVNGDVGERERERRRRKSREVDGDGTGEIEAVAQFQDAVFEVGESETSEVYEDESEWRRLFFLR